MKKRIIYIFFLIFTIGVFSVYADDYPKGDVNGNNKVDSADYILVRKHILKQTTLTGDKKTRADVNNDGKISSLDFVVIRKIIIKGETSSPTPVPSVTPKPTVSSTPANTPKPTATATPKPTDTPTPTATAKPVEKEDVYVYFYNPNVKSDAILIVSGNKTMVIDGGVRNSSNKFIDYIKTTLNNLEKNNGIKFNKDSSGNYIIDAYVGTHGHPDHVALAGKIITTFNIQKVYIPKGSIPEKLNGTDNNNKWYIEKENPGYNGTYKNYVMAMMLKRCVNKEERLAIEKLYKNGNVIKLDISSNKFTLGKSTFTVLNPFDENWPIDDPPIFDDQGKRTNSPINENSLMLRMDSGNTSFLFAGDVNDGKANTRIKKKFGSLMNVNVYKNGHHHSRFTLVENKNKQVTDIKNRIKEIDPDYIIFSADTVDLFDSSLDLFKKYLSYQPNPSTKGLKNMYSVNCGTVVVKSDGTNITILEGNKYYDLNTKKACTNKNAK